MQSEYFLSTKQHLIDNINRAMYDNGWNLRILSEKADIPYESLKKLMNSKINNPSLSSLLRISLALDCSIDTLLGLSCNNVSPLLSDVSYFELPPRAIELMKEIAKFETQLARQNNANETHYIPVIIPTGNLYDGMLFDSFYIQKTDIVKELMDGNVEVLFEPYGKNMAETLDISGYTDIIDNSVLCAIKIINKALHPTYIENDYLLISRDRHPTYGETGIFLKKNRIYIRKYLCGETTTLAPVNGVGRPLTDEDTKDMYIFGRVLTTIRSK